MAEQMKPSGIDWIGDIPDEWDITKVRFVTKLRSEQGFYNSDDKYIGLENISSYTGEYISTESEYDAGIYDLYKTGDLLFSKLRPYLAKALIADDCGFCTGELAVIKEYNGDIRYLFYYMLSDGFLKMVDASTYGAKMPRASWDYIKNLQIPVIGKAEQQAIADFLDKECGQIDSIAADLEKQIALLQKYKKSLITETVTKGLDKSVPMKDSGIEGVGKIPSHWKVNRLKYAAVVKTGPFGTQLSASEYSDEGIPVINVKNIGYGTIIEDDLDYVPDEVCQRLAQHQLQFGDIVFGRKGAVDKHAIITESQIGWVQGSDCIRVRIYKDIESRYLNYLFDTVYFAEYVLLYAVGTTMASINSDILTNSKILVPPITEQRCIADFLDSNCKVLSEIIENKQSQLATLQQHKKSLIYEYVTGKKRVKEVQ